MRLKTVNSKSEYDDYGDNIRNYTGLECNVHQEFILYVKSK